MPGDVLEASKPAKIGLARPPRPDLGGETLDDSAGLKPARGMVRGIVLSAPFWLLAIWAVFIR